MTTNEAHDAALKGALSAVKGLRAKVGQLTRARREAIAVVGIGVRLPGGVNSPRALHDSLSAGVDAITEVTSERWNHAEFYDADVDAVGRTHMRHAGLIENVDTFDADFFGMSPREAAHVDPQQRLLLEVAWEALEDAGIPAERLAGSGAGVYIGANSSDYLTMQLARPETVDLYTVVGGTNCIIANRLSYQLDLRGPSLAVDTACSSSLVAVHLAVQALRSEECDSAVAGGVNLLLSPVSCVAHSKGLPLSADGRCKTFDAAADGYVRGEGVAVVVLKRLSDAVLDHDRIYATIRGSAVNQDGRTNGLTAPSGRAQKECITAAVKNAGIDASQVSLVEAHGTGTSLGDPIEVEALAETYGAVSGPVCRLGSIKTNIGHLEAAAGVVGLVKGALAVHHKAIYPTLHLDTVNPHLQIEGTRLGFAPGSVQVWDGEADQRMAAISAFGAGGTNAHVILGPPPAGLDTSRSDTTSESEGPTTLRISASTSTALAELAGRYADALQDSDRATLLAVAKAASRRRTQLGNRLSVSGASPDDIVAALRSAALGVPGLACSTGSAKATGGTVFVFPGQGPHWVGMAARLRASNVAFAQTVGAVDEAMQPLLGRSILGVIDLGDDGDFPIEYVQPALFTVAVGLTAAWRDAGVEPDAVIGHSMGEVAAAYVAGALSLADAVAVICHRASLLARIAGQGGMLVVGVGSRRARELCGGHEDVCVGVINSAHTTVLSGAQDTLERIAADLERENVFTKFVAVDVASHSPQVEPLRSELVEALGGIQASLPRVDMVSTVTGAVLTEPPRADYWYSNMRDPVRFAVGIEALLGAGNDTFIEMSPHPTLADPIEQICAESGTVSAATWSLHRELDDVVALDRAMGFLYTHRRRGPWPSLRGGDHTEPVPMVSLPTYPFARERHWFRQGEWSNPWATQTVPREQHQTSTRSSPDPAGGEARTWTEATVRELVVQTVAETLVLAPGQLDVDAGFFSLGMDSMLAAKAKNRLAGSLGAELPTRLMFEHPTASELASFLTNQVCGRQAAPEDLRPRRSSRQHETKRTAGIASTDDDLISALEIEVQRSPLLEPGGPT